MTVSMLPLSVFDDFANVNISLLSGFKTTLLIFFITLAASLPLGLLITMGSMSKIAPVKAVVRTFVWIIRGTPLMLQVMIIFYGPGLLFDYPMKDRLTAVLIAFIINYAAYFSEIYRGGISSIPQGQYEACKVLGMTKSQTFFRVILLQVIKRIIPPMSNEIITLVKDTSLARVISVTELMRSAQDIVNQRAIIWPLFYIGVFYLLFSGLLTILFNFIEKKMSYFNG